MLFSEQECLLYEYYVIEEFFLYEVGYLENFNQFNSIFNEMVGVGCFIVIIIDVFIYLKVVLEVVEVLYKNLMFL